MREETARTRLQKIVLAAMAAMILFFGVWMCISQFHKGVLFDGALLERTVVPDQTTYTGSVHGEAVTITVQNDGGPVTAVRYDTETVHDVYTMEYPLPPGQTSGGYREGGVRVLKNGQLLFAGAYDAERSMWYDANGDWESGVTVTASCGNAHEPAGAPETLNYRNVAYFARGPELTARGSWEMYTMLVFLTLLLMLDAAYPTALFRLRYGLDVRDPEPSELYLSLQRGGWAVYPFLLLAGYFVAVWQL